MPPPPRPAMLLSVPLLLGLLGLAAADPAIYFKEQFLDGDAWTNRWVESKHKSDFGKFVLSSGKFYGDLEKDKGTREWVQDNFLEEAVVSTYILLGLFPGTREPRTGGGRKGGQPCPSRSRVFRVHLMTVPFHHRAADKPRCPILRTVRQIRTLQQ